MEYVITIKGTAMQIQKALLIIAYMFPKKLAFQLFIVLQ